MSIEAEWIEWRGGECPVKAGTMVDVKFRDGATLTDVPANQNIPGEREAAYDFWHNEGGQFDITAYRIHNAFEGAPDDATHLLERQGVTKPAIFCDGGYWDINGDSSYCMIDDPDGGPDAWQVIATRKQTEPSLNIECGEVYESFDNLMRVFTGSCKIHLDGVDVHEPEYTGGSVSYYTARIDHPTNPSREPYEAECNDIIEALNMNYAEGNAFKAIWRKCAARLGTAKKGYTDGLYDAEKIVFFGERMVEQERNK